MSPQSEESLWRCPFCEALHPWPQDVVDILDGHPPAQPTTGRVRLECSCRAWAVVQGQADPNTTVRFHHVQPAFDPEAARHSTLFQFRLRSEVYRRVTVSGELVAVLVDWVRTGA